MRLSEILSQSTLRVAPAFAEGFRSVLGKQFNLLLRRDHQQRASKPYYLRHRLPVLLDVVDKWAHGFTGRPPIVPLAAIGELGLALELFRKWQSDPEWPKILRSLSNPTDYAHTVVLLGLAQHLRSDGSNAYLRRESDSGRTCDLLAVSPDGVSVNVEVKVPRDLLWPRSPLVPAVAAAHIKKLFHKTGTTVRGQLPPSRPGVLAVGGLSFDDRTLNLLHAAGSNFLRRPPGDYSHVLGVLFIWTGARLHTTPPQAAGDEFLIDGRLDMLTEMRLAENPTYTGALHWMVDRG